MTGIAVSTGIYMSVESLGRRAIPALARLGARGGVRGIDLIKGIKLRIPANGPPVHVYPTEHVHQHVSQVSHVVAEPEPEASYSHVSYASYAEPQPESYYVPRHLHHSHHSPHYSHLHYGHYGHGSPHALVHNSDLHFGGHPGLGLGLESELGGGLGGGFLDAGLFD